MNLIDLNKTLINADLDKEYIIKSIDTGDSSLKHFLLTLGCFPGEVIKVLSVLSESYVISLKDARYSIGQDLAEAIQL